MTSKQPSKVLQGDKITYDSHEGPYFNGCPNCGQDYAAIYIGSMCVECNTVFEIEEVEVTWDEE